MTAFASQKWHCGLLLAAALLSGCATSRSVVAPQIDAVANPAQGIAVRIEKIDDARRFEVDPPEPSIPSLMDNQIADDALRSRAIARKRNTFGKALGDVLLPEGQSVAKLTESAITRTFRAAGYRVLGVDDPDYAQAIPVSGRVEKLWAWFRPGFWALALEANYEVTLSTTIAALQRNPKLTGQVRNTMQIATEDDWSAIVTKALDDFSARLQDRLLDR
jgi:hypothetical protein